MIYKWKINTFLYLAIACFEMVLVRLSFVAGRINAENF